MTHPQPSVDLGYPTPAHGRIPSFTSIEEEAAFWDTHSVTDFPDDIRLVGVSGAVEFTGDETADEEGSRREWGPRSA